MVDLDGVGLTPDPFLAAFGPKVLELGGAGFPFWDALLLFVVGFVGFLLLLLFVAAGGGGGLFLLLVLVLLLLLLLV